MARYKPIDAHPRFLAVDLHKHLLPGSLAHAVNHLFDHDFDLSGFDARYRSDAAGACGFSVLRKPPNPFGLSVAQRSRRWRPAVHASTSGSPCLTLSTNGKSYRLCSMQTGQAQQRANPECVDRMNEAEADILAWMTCGGLRLWLIQPAKTTTVRSARMRHRRVSGRAVLSTPSVARYSA